MVWWCDKHKCHSIDDSCPRCDSEYERHEEERLALRGIKNPKQFVKRAKAIEKAAMELRDRMDDIACRYKGSIISALIMNQIADFDADFDAATETKE